MAFFDIVCYNQTFPIGEFFMPLSTLPMWLRRELQKNQLKFCPLCEQVLEHQTFARNKTTKDRLQVYCRECMRIKSGRQNAPRKPSILTKFPREEVQRLRAEGHAHCFKCNSVKPLEDFPWRSAGIRKGLCKECNKAHVQKWKATEVGSYKTQVRAARSNHPYLTQQQAELSVRYRQGGTCPICTTVAPLVIDHCHRRMIFRDFICMRCNTLLGYLEPAEVVQNALRYLEKHHG